MRLTLEVISANGDALGSNRSKTIGPEGAQIGRSKESDWVINDPYISRIHARVRFVNGTYYVEGTGRNPLALNDPSNVVPNNQPQLLRNGDRFFLDQYEIRATVDTAAERKPPPMDPFAQESDSPTVRVPPVVPVIPPQQPWHPAEAHPNDIRVPNADDAVGLDPLDLLDGKRNAPPPPVRPINLEQGPVIENQFSPPQPLPRPLNANEPTPVPVSAATQKIPEEYRPGFTHIVPAMPQVEPTTRKIPPTPGGGSNQLNPGGRGAKGIPNSWLNPTNFSSADPGVAQPPLAAQTAPLYVGPPPAERPEPRLGAAERPESRPDPRINGLDRPEARPVGAERPEPRVSPVVAKTLHRPGQANVLHAPPAEPPPARETRSASLEQLLASAGLPASQMSPELAQELGEVLRVVVQGLMEVLQSRAEIKSQLRMNMTRMQPAENNPLKFSPNVEAALHTLLVERNRGYLPTVRAFQEALIDIRHHQIAVLQGIRSAFQAMLEQFNPVRLEQEFDRHGGKRGLLNVGAKGRFRDAYIEEFERLTRDPDESFKRLFGEYFAQAYEDQMEYLKAAARTDAR